MLIEALAVISLGTAAMLTQEGMKAGLLNGVAQSGLCPWSQ